MIGKLGDIVKLLWIFIVTLDLLFSKFRTGIATPIYKISLCSIPLHCCQEFYNLMVLISLLYMENQGSNLFYVVTVN